VLPGEVAVAACTSATLLALLNTREVSVEDSATCPEMLFPPFENPEIVHMVPARALFAPGDIRAEVTDDSGAPGVVWPTQEKT
jgi:hypothetical protein